MPIPIRPFRALVAALALFSATQAVAVLPGAPTGVSATVGNGMAVVSFVAPAVGAPILFYTVTSSPGNIVSGGTSSPIEIGNLTNGLAYTFTVQASNASGNGPLSAPSNSVTPPGYATTIAVTSSPNASRVGQSVTLTATVNIPGVITVAPLSGRVSFEANGVAIPGCGAVPFVDMVTPRSAFCTTSALEAGPHALSAEYSGSATLNASTSPPLIHNVLEPFPLVTYQDINDIGIIVTSEPVTLPAFAGTLPITVTGGQYSIGCTANFTTTPGTVTSGATVCVRQVTPLAWYASVPTTLAVGGVTSVFEPYLPNCCTPTQPISIAAGIGHTLAISDDGEVWGWGDNTGGRLGNGASSSSSLPVQAFLFPVGLAAGLEHSLALNYDGTVGAWGLNSEGQLGLDAGNLTTCLVPGQTGPLAGGRFSCMPYPRIVSGLQNVVAVSAGWRHSLALKSDGTVWAWGSGYWGQNGATVTRQAPVLVPISGTVVRIAAGYMHSVALLSDGTVVAWGSSQFGELGPAPVNASNINPAPRAVTGLTNVTDIAAGGSYTLARKSDGSVWAWGANIYAALGDPNLARSNGSGPVSRSTPAAVPGLTSVARISAGFAAAFAIKDTGSIVSWGLNRSGQANGTPQATPKNCGATNGYSCILAPAAVSAASGATRIYAGGAHVVAAKNNGDLIMFGDNSAGQLATRAGNFGTKFGQSTYDPDAFLNPQGVNGSPIGIGRPSTAGGLNLVTIGSGLAFDAVNVGATASTQVLSVTNLLATGSISFSRIEAISYDITGEFSGTNTCMLPLLASLAPGASCNITLSFAPKGVGDRSGQIVIESNAADATSISFDLAGTGLDPRAASSLALTTPGGSSQVFGTPMTFVATISAAVPISGTVDFSQYDGNASSAIAGCTAVAVVAGSASCTTSTLGLGSHYILGSYSGSPTVQPTYNYGQQLTVVATAPAPMTLSVSKGGIGTGSVASSPAGIDCGATCTANFVTGASVTLTATPAAGSFFTGWSGACTGTGTCTVTMDAARSVAANFTTQSASIPRLVNIATRMQVLTGNDVLIGGFVIGGTVPKTVVVRARGPSLIGQGVPNALLDPVLQLFSGPTQVGSNDNWKTAANQATLSASGYAPGNDLESAIYTTLAPGGYTAIVTGAGGTTGVGIIEVFEVDHPEIPLVNIATRGQVLTGGDVMIGGFVVQGDAPQTVIIRARGPSLVAAGITNALANPVLQLLSGQTVIAANDDWQASPNAAQIQARGFAPANALESAILVTLPPGGYTAIVTGAGGTTGVGIIEVFAQ